MRACVRACVRACARRVRVSYQPQGCGAQLLRGVHREEELGLEPLGLQFLPQGQVRVHSLRGDPGEGQPLDHPASRLSAGLSGLERVHS